MSLQSSHQATPARVPTPVLNRVTLHEGSVVSVHVPQEARSGNVQDGDRTVYFLQFTHKVEKQGGGIGLVNFFVHAETQQELEQFYGNTVTAHAKIVQKNLEDGRTFINVDLLPAEGEPMHELFVLFNETTKNKVSIPYSEVDWERFDTPSPLRGAVVLVSKTAARLELIPTETRKPSSSAQTESMTGYPGLDRLLGDGWKVDSADENVVNLWKMKGEERKTTVFHKPKDKNKKKR